MAKAISSVMNLLVAVESNMPQLTVDGIGEFEIPHGKRLVLALREEAGVDQLHACGGHARCTTCRVEFLEGEPQKITQAEKDCLAERNVDNARLSCQIVCEQDMTVRIVSRLAGSGREDCGQLPTEAMQPEPAEWTEK
tara:strand:+ start:114 stop:527 length:414 start_codon:yes stop_codon:yes gene_type:complete